MKAASVLLGLGVGLVITTIAFFFAYKRDENLNPSEIHTVGSPTDIDVMEQALRMGMVWPDDDEVTTQEFATEPITESTVKIGQNACGLKPPIVEPALQWGIEPSLFAAFDTNRLRGGSMKCLDESCKIDETPITDEDSTAFVDVTIQYGGSATFIANQLYRAGIVNDALEFTEYLIEHSQTRRIKTGKCVLPLNASYEDVTEIITLPYSQP